MDRQKCTELIVSKLQPYHQNLENVKLISQKIEQGIFEFANNDPKIYRQQSRNILANIGYTPNSEMVREKLFDGVWDGYCVGKMTSEELYPERKEKELEELQKEQEIKESFKQMQMSRNSIYTCGRCKKNKVEHYQRQVRSSDEPMTVFCTCLTCGYRWKFC